jgi:hypothetical protein
MLWLECGRCGRAGRWRLEYLAPSGRLADSSSADFLHDDLDAGQQIFGGGGDVAAHLVCLYGEQVLDNGRVDIAAGRLPVGA